MDIVDHLSHLLPKNVAMIFIWLRQHWMLLCIQTCWPQRIHRLLLRWRLDQAMCSDDGCMVPNELQWHSSMLNDSMRRMRGWRCRRERVSDGQTCRSTRHNMGPLRHGPLVVKLAQPADLASNACLSMCCTSRTSTSNRKDEPTKLDTKDEPDYSSG